MSEITVETRGKVALVTLDAPPVNALTMARYRAIGETFDALGKRVDVHCAIFTSAGTRAFCAGLDLQEFLASTVADDPARAMTVRKTFAALRNCAIPVVAAVNGPALGAGCVLTACCDIRIASEKATFGLPEINVGRCGGGAHVGRLVPQGVLRRLFFTGKPMSAQDAYRAGFVEEVVAPERLMDAAMELAGVISEKSPLGLRYGKEALNKIELMSAEDGYALEQTYSTKLLHTEDAKEATRSVIEKRKPVFKGR